MAGSFMTGDMIANDYRILGHIGYGGFSDVYKALNTRINRIVAIKEYRDLGKSVIQELEILKELRHSYLPQVYDIIDNNGSEFLVMEYIDGVDLFSFVQQKAYWCLK